MKNCLITILVMTAVLSVSGCATRGDYQLLKTADRETAEDWLYMADFLYRLRDYGAAMYYYERVLEVYPDSIYACTAEKKFKKARKYYIRKTTEGQKLASLNDSRSVEDYHLLKGGEQENAEDWLSTANFLYRLREYGAAIDYYEKIVEFYPNSIYAYAAEKRLKKAKKYYFKSIKKY